MRANICKILQILLIGLAIGLCLSIRWLHIIRGPIGSAAGYSLGAILVLALASGMFLHIRMSHGKLPFARYLISSVISIISLSAIAYCIGINPIGFLLGDDLAISAKQYYMPPFDSLLYAFIFVTVGIYVSAQTYSLVSFPVNPRMYLVLLLASIFIGVSVSLVYLLSFYYIMWTGLEALSVVVSLCISFILVAFAAVILYEIIIGYKKLIYLACALAVLGVCAVCCTALGSGGQYFSYIRTINPDVSYVYIHFLPDGTHRRTIDLEGQDVKLRKLQEFVSDYPLSAYRPAALLSIAECQFSLWQFKDAQATLSNCIRSYPGLGNYQKVLWALSSLGANEPQSILGSINQKGLCNWFNGQGSLIAASASERANQPCRSLGFYSAYVNHLLEQPQSPNIAQSISYAKSKIDNIHKDIETSGQAIFTGALRFHVKLDGKPVSLCRIALVQPHYNIAVPSDSRHFTGSWSVPAWNTYWASTDKNGVATIFNIPYGAYDLVVGLNAKTTPKNIVLGQQKTPVVIDSPECKPVYINLKPRIEVISPVSLSDSNLQNRLIWRPYPGAHHYSVTILKCGPVSSAEDRGSLPNASTVWSRGNIRDNSTSIDSRFYVSPSRQLDEDSIYMWVVFAYDSEGRIISSSEHYFDFFEPTFTKG